MESAIERAWRRFDSIDDPALRGRTLFELIPCFPLDKRGPLYGAVAHLASDIPADMDRVEFLIDTLGTPAHDTEVEAIRRGIAADLNVTDPLARTLLTLAFATPQARVVRDTLSIAATFADDESRRRVLEALPHHDLAKGDLDAYVTVAESISEPGVRAEAALPVARYAAGSLVQRVTAIAESADDSIRNQLYVEMEAFVAQVDPVRSREARRARNSGIGDAELRARCQLTVLSLGASNDENELTAGLVFDAIDEIDGIDVRLDILGRYRYSLPGVAPWCADRALRLVLDIPSQRLRARGLSLIAGLAESREILAAAGALEDPWAETTVLFSYRYGPPPGQGTADSWYRRLWSAALRVTEPVPRARFLTLLATSWEDPDVKSEVLSEALRAADDIMQPWVRVQAMDRIFELSRPNSSLTAEALRLAAEEPAPERRARAIARVSRYLGAEAREQALDAALADLWENASHARMPAAIRNVIHDGQLQIW